MIFKGSSEQAQPPWRDLGTGLLRGCRRLWARDETPDWPGWLHRCGERGSSDRLRDTHYGAARSLHGIHVRWPGPGAHAAAALTWPLSGS
jgi:hypothetical protein